jgi:hypothetical protein
MSSNRDLRDTIHNLSRDVELDNTSEVLLWFVNNVCNHNGLLIWPTIYLIIQEPQMKWWTDTAIMLLHDINDEISYNTRRYLYKDLKRWLLRVTK